LKKATIRKGRNPTRTSSRKTLPFTAFMHKS
jgi:hypothetical protein